jgi:hypothetical protein
MEVSLVRIRVFVARRRAAAQLRFFFSFYERDQIFEQHGEETPSRNEGGMEKKIEKIGTRKKKKK